MRKVLILALLLSSCGPKRELAPAVQIPPLSEELAQKAKPLPPSTDPSFEGLILDYTFAIKAYNDVASRYNTLIDQYNCARNKTCQ